jgi:RNA polymerase sigma-70 factor, ECF subfamily
LGRVTTTPRDDPCDWVDLRRRCLGEARGLVADPADAEDVVQEALIRGWRRWESYGARGSRLGWLLSITRNEALRWRHGPRGRREPRLEDLADDLLARPAGCDGILERVDVRSAMDGLSGDDRRLLRLRYEHDLTQRRIAELLGLPEGTVKIRLHRLRQRLGRELAS